ncbi:MAG TPA: DUF58 domain-containing protein [Pirellula sp.]|nr:DUF58 domain-containing protein [Pirellula sp.]
MTRRAQLLAVSGMIGLFLGLVRGQTVLSLLSLSSLVWLLSDWLLFYWHVRFHLPLLSPVRMINGELNANRSLWAERIIEVQVQLREIRLLGVTLDLLDVVPENVEVVHTPITETKAGQATRVPQFLTRQSKSWLIRNFVSFIDCSEHNNANQIRMGLGSRQSDWGYSARVRAAGQVVFPGFRLTLRSTHLLFQKEKFIKWEQSFRALPSFVDAGEYRALTKKSNVIPRHGIHTLHRSGMGSELLELREYMPGDPFKSIAWKVSGKRDQWMSRQYESEVPARVQLLVDGSSSSRIGGFGHRLIDQMTFVAASIGRIATNAGDPVGGVLSDERGMQRLPPMSGEKGFQILLRTLSDFSVNPSPPPSPLNQRMIEAAWSLISQRFPELLDFKVNQFPFFVFPILPMARARRRQRFLIAGALTEIYSLSTREHVAMLHNDEAFARRVQQLLNSSGIPWVAPVISTFECRDREPMARMTQLADCILTAVSHARDNEVFVVMSDLLNCVSVLEFLLPAVKLAIAKHHRVTFICPTSTFRRASRIVDADFSGNWSTDELLLVAEQARLQIQAEQLRREIHRCGASVSLAGEKSAIRLIMSELNAAKAGRSKFQGTIR